MEGEEGKKFEIELSVESKQAVYQFVGYRYDENGKKWARFQRAPEGTVVDPNEIHFVFAPKDGANEG